MKRFPLLLFFLLFLWLPFTLEAQSPSMLRLDDVFIILRSNHPIARQINLLSDRAKAQLRLARGGFDPKLFGTYDDKFFDDKNYWRVFESGIKIPTMLPVDLKAGYAWNDGSFLNTEKTLPAQGQMILGGSVTLGQGLLMDKRRATLRQAKIFGQMAEVEQVRLLNNLFWEAAQVYWQWAADYGRLRVYEQSVQAASRRFEAIRATFFAGDYAGIDTTEALTQLQNFQLLRNEAQIIYRNSTFELSNFLWNEEGIPLEITDQLTPVRLGQIAMPIPVSNDSIRRSLASVDLHPEVRKFDFKRSELEVERRLKAEKLRPVIDLEYNFLSPQNALNGEDVGLGQWQWGQNYKWGATIEFPLFLRKERGDLALARLKIRENDLEQQQKQQVVINKILAYANELEILRTQVDLYTDAVANYQRMLDGEEQKFAAGESTLFLINSRELKLLDAQIKLLELRSKLFKAKAGLEWAQGLLAN